ncbi:hypothetical protein BD770DRAFT_221974 [Pilaira anomala]|nr:hypothetical protein BD770DRAFT_221974 [Pilaira anomala]
MLVLPVLCYIVAAISFAIPPLSFLFRDFESTYCTFDSSISSTPAWVEKEASSPPPEEVCKSVSIMTDLFLKTSPEDVCLKTTEKGLVVFVPSLVPAVSWSVCFPLFPLGPVPSSSFTAFSFPAADQESFTSTVKALFQKLMIGGRSLKDGLLYPSRPLMIVFTLIPIVYLTFYRGFNGGRLRRVCPYSFCDN